MDLLRFNTLRGTKTALLIPKRYDEHPRHCEGELINMTRAWDKEKFWVPDRICPTLASCWLIHLHISLPSLKFTIFINLSLPPSFLNGSPLPRDWTGGFTGVPLSINQPKLVTLTLPPAAISGVSPRVFPLSPSPGERDRKKWPREILGRATKSSRGHRVTHDGLSKRMTTTL